MMRLSASGYAKLAELESDPKLRARLELLAALKRLVARRRLGL